VSFEMTFEGVK